ncbi:hypothetical protein WJX74_007214 [Apatococcus lobatus]|uniref:DNA damage-binding protein 1 n=2 Tax=Apatococcus TaxID=904362 RepID=A0AAW1TDF8_9CHLO
MAERNVDNYGHYVVSAHKPTVVTHSVVGRFTGPDDLNLIIAKTSRIEIYKLTAEGLQGVADVPIYGRVSVLQLFNTANGTKDRLFLLTERYRFCVLDFDIARGQLITLANGDVQDRVGRPCDDGHHGVIDATCRMIALLMYDAMIKIIPIDERGLLHEAFNVRIDELSIRDMQFLHGCSRPTLAVLYEDTMKLRHLKTYEISVREKDLEVGSWQQSSLDRGASMIIPVPTPFGGAVVVGSTSVCYFSSDPSRQPLQAVKLQQTIIRSYGKVDADGSRYILGDDMGALSLLILAHNDQSIVALKLEPIGRGTVPSSISYLDNGVVYLGSQRGDSQLIRLHAQPVDTSQQPPSHVEVLETHMSLGPIVDFCVVDVERQGQGQVVTCSGVGTEGSLRIVRNGIGMIEQASVELPGIKGMWSLRHSLADESDSLLVITFVGDTRILAINAEDELEEAELPGFDTNVQTLHCSNVMLDQIIQVTQNQVRLLDASSRNLRDQWQPKSNTYINAATATPSQVLLAAGGGNLIYLEIQEGQLIETAHKQLDQEIACLDLTSTGGGSQHLAAVGTWTMQLLLLSLPSMQLLREEQLGGEVIPRSLLFAEFEGESHLLAGLGDGHLFNFHLDPSTAALENRRKLSLGTKPITLKPFRSKGATHVFAASDRPTVIYSSNKKLLYSNVNEGEVNFMCPFNSSSFPESLALAKETGLTIGNMDEIQKLHIRSVPLGEQPRRLAHQDSSRTFGVALSQCLDPSGGESFDALRLMDDQTFEVMDSHDLKPDEWVFSLATMTLGDTPQYYILGTAYVLENELEPSKGRILVFEVRDRKLHMLAEKETRGAVYNLAHFQGKLLAGINSRVQLFKWNQKDDGSWELTTETGHSGHVLALYLATRGDFIIVGDVMKSMQLLMYKPEDGKLEVRARDFHSNWMTAVEVLDDDKYIGAENSYNLFTVRKNSDAAADEERGRLEETGSFHLGDFVNTFRHGSLVMRLPDSEAAQIPTLIFGTVSGTIGVIASLNKQQFLFFEKLQGCLRKVIKGVGGFDHAHWRSFHSERTTQECRNFVDGDLIEQFLDLDPHKVEAVAKDMGSNITGEDLIKAVEEMAQLH